MDKLLNKMHEFFPDFNMTLNDLKNPTITFVRDFYSRVLIELGVDSDNVRKAQIDQLEFAQDIDLLPFLNLITAINAAFPFLDFSLFDMLFPNPKRNAGQMSKVMHFMVFCESRVFINNEEVVKCQEAKELENQLITITDTKSKEIDDISCELESAEQAKQELREQIETMEINNQDLTMHIAKLKEDIQHHDQHLISMDKEIQSCKNQIDSYNSEIDALRAQIVSNPNEEKCELESKLRHKTGVIEKKKELEDKLNEYKETKEKMQLQQDMLLKRVVPLVKDLEVLFVARQMDALALKNKNELEDLQKKKEKMYEEFEEAREKFEIEKCNLTNNRLTEHEKEKAILLKDMVDKTRVYDQVLKKLIKQKKSLNVKIASIKKNKSNLESEFKEFYSRFSTVKEAIKFEREALEKMF